MNFGIEKVLILSVIKNYSANKVVQWVPHKPCYLSLVAQTYSGSREPIPAAVFCLLYTCHSLCSPTHPLPSHTHRNNNFNTNKVPTLKYIFEKSWCLHIYSPWIVVHMS